MVLRFIPQATLDSWMDQGKVDLQNDHLVDLATREEFPMREAIYFVKVESGADTPNWAQKVLSLEEIRAGGAEHYMTSVILGETVYFVDPGWMAEESAETAAAPANPTAKTDGKNPEAAALAQLLLDKLS